MSAKKEIFLGPITDEGRNWCADNAWFEDEQGEVDRYIHESDPRLSSDPLTALAAVMQHHMIVFEHKGLSILADAEQVFYSQIGPEDCDTIKPEQKHEMD